MQAFFIFPLLMSVLAMAISLFMAVLAGVSAVPPIMAADFIILSLVHAIIAADAGETANATKATAMSKIFIESLLRKTKPASCRPSQYVFSGEDVSWRRRFSCCGAKTQGSAAGFRGFGPVTNAACCDIGFARGSAALLRLAAIDVAGETIDQPHVLVGWRLKPDIAGGQPRDQCRQQDRHRDHRRADVNGHGAQGHGPIRRAIAIKLVITWPRHWVELGSLRLRLSEAVPC